MNVNITILASCIRYGGGYNLQRYLTEYIHLLSDFPHDFDANNSHYVADLSGEKFHIYLCMCSKQRNNIKRWMIGSQAR